MCVSVIGQVCTIDQVQATAVIDVDGRHQTVSLVTLEIEGIAVVPGDWVLVHTGFAVEVVDPDDAVALIDEQQAARGSMNDTAALGAAEAEEDRG